MKTGSNGKLAVPIPNPMPKLMRILADLSESVPDISLEKL
jgi:hypothetical protein